METLGILVAWILIGVLGSIRGVRKTGGWNSKNRPPVELLVILSLLGPINWIVTLIL